MEGIVLQTLWYLIIGASIVFYAILDGFDLGVGMLHLFTKEDKDRRIFLNAIGPVWDGNEVWLVIVGGALFAGFPAVYASLLSGFYNLVMFWLAGLIFRAVAIEFRSKHNSPTWRKSWDFVFAIASYFIAFGLGVLLGNLIEGLPIDESGHFTGRFALIFRPYPVLVGLMSVTLFLMHGAIFLTMKTEGKLHDKLRVWVTRTLFLFVISYIVVTAYTLLQMQHMIAPLKKDPYLFLIPIGTFVSLMLVPYLFKRGKDMAAFLFSSIGIALIFFLFGMGFYPNLVRSSLDPDHNSLTISNSASSDLTLKVLLLIVAIGIPLVLAYGTCIYRIFRGKVKIGPSSY